MRSRLVWRPRTLFPVQLRCKADDFTIFRQCIPAIDSKYRALSNSVAPELRICDALYLRDQLNSLRVTNSVRSIHADLDECSTEPVLAAKLLLRSALLARNVIYRASMTTSLMSSVSTRTGRLIDWFLCLVLIEA
jgi:hypothetical protein